MDSLSLAILIPVGVLLLGIELTFLYIVGVFIYGIICKIFKKED